MRITLDKGAFLPERAHSNDAGLDIKSPVTVIVPAHGSVVIDTGVHVEIWSGCVGFLKSKSGLNVKHDIQSEGVIDSGYTGSIVVKLYNLGDGDYLVERGDKISQLVVFPILIPEIEVVDSLDETERGNNGFGSSGK